MRKKKIIGDLCEAIIDEQHRKCPPYTPPMDDRCQCGVSVHGVNSLKINGLIFKDYCLDFVTH